MVDRSTEFDGLTPYEALCTAIDILRSQAALARVCEVSPTAVWKWVQSSKRVPPEFVLRVEDATGIPCYVLNPDTYPPARFRAPVRFMAVDQHVPRVSFNQQTVLKDARA